MDANAKELRRKLRVAGLTEKAVDAAWPSWWSDDAAQSRSAQAELRFSVARKLGVSASALARDEVQFAWRDQTRFKHLRNETSQEQAVLASFGLGLANHIAAAASRLPDMALPSANELREAILQTRPVVDLLGLMGTCWAIGIPVIYLRVFPLDGKHMHAMVAKSGERHVILLARDTRYPAQAAFTLAHELGHIALGHLAGQASLVDLDDPASAIDRDEEEVAADRYALELLTGSPDPDIRAAIDNPSGRALAAAATESGVPRRIDPGTLALCFGYRTGNWQAANAALRHLYPNATQVWYPTNELAMGQLDWSSLSSDSQDFLSIVMGING